MFGVGLLDQLSGLLWRFQTSLKPSNQSSTPKLILFHHWLTYISSNSGANIRFHPFFHHLRRFPSSVRQSPKLEYLFKMKIPNPAKNKHLSSITFCYTPKTLLKSFYVVEHNDLHLFIVVTGKSVQFPPFQCFLVHCWAT